MYSSEAWGHEDVRRARGRGGEDFACSTVAPRPDPAQYYSSSSHISSSRRSSSPARGSSSPPRADVGAAAAISSARAAQANGASSSSGSSPPSTHTHKQGSVQGDGPTATGRKHGRASDADDDMPTTHDDIDSRARRRVRDDTDDTGSLASVLSGTRRRSSDSAPHSERSDRSARDAYDPSLGADSDAAPSAVFLTAPVGRRTYRPPKRVVRGECRSVNEFEKLGRVGEGTYGVVYRARDSATGAVVAIKRVKMENETGGMPVSSIREIALLRRARGHPNVVRLLDVVIGRDLSAVFLAMEFCEFCDAETSSLLHMHTQRDLLSSSHKRVQRIIVALNNRT